MLRFLTIFLFSLAANASNEDNEFSIFGKNYLSFELVRNQPFSETQKKYQSGDATVFATYRHFAMQRWMMGVHAGFKRFLDKDTRQHLTLATVGQESYYVTRVTHPIYFAAGGKLLYLLPTESKKIPPKRARKPSREIGAAASIHLSISFIHRFCCTFASTGGVESTAKYFLVPKLASDLVTYCELHIRQINIRVIYKSFFLTTF